MIPITPPNPDKVVVVINVGKHDITDCTRKAGKRWTITFASKAKKISGDACATYGVSQRERSTACL